jgi:serine phosphatase RsbU (regulator of sigma subunit)
VVVVGVLITAGLSLGARSVHNSNENRLLRQRAREVAAVAAAAIPNVQTPLASAAALAQATNGNRAAFRELVAPIVATGRPFVSVSLWSTRAAALRPLVVVGGQPELLTETPAAIRQFLGRATGRPTVAINDLLGARQRRLGYAVSAPSAKPRFVVYGEAELPKSRKATIAKDSAFADLGYALYLGRTADQRNLLASSTGGALLQGRRASFAVPFGDSQLLVVLTPHTELGGALLARLWWMLGALGLLITLVAALLVERLTRRRHDAEVLAGENARLYAQQRSVAQTLQHSLLAEAFPEIGSLEFAARYIAGVEGIDIGGDWYDVVRLERGNILIVVGDVSGRGLEAATMMASLRFAGRAYAAEGHSPSVILSKLSGLLTVGRDGHFATVLCGLLDVSNGQIVMANAGHPEPLLIAPTGAEFVATRVGVPVGVKGGRPYEEVRFAFPRGSTLLMYTDGAIERRGEHLDLGLQRLRDVSVGAQGPLEQFLSEVVAGVGTAGTDDDTALLAVRWKD